MGVGDETRRGTLRRQRASVGGEGRGGNGSRMERHTRRRKGAVNAGQWGTGEGSGREWMGHDKAG